MKHFREILICLALAVPAGAAEPPATTTRNNTVTVDLGGGVTMEFVQIAPGTFRMGDRTNAHTVTLTKPFLLGKCEVTQEQWEAVMGGNPSHTKGKKLPAESITHEDCREFIRRLAEKAPGKTFRLPTEAEWEYACRAGSTTTYCNGDAPADLEPYGWYEDNSGGTTHPVGEKLPNAWGLHDMHGNVWEWCADWYGDYAGNDVNDPAGPASGTLRVTRGGEINRHANHSTSAFRGRSGPKTAYKSLGMRVVMEAF